MDSNAVTITFIPMNQAISEEKKSVESRVKFALAIKSRRHKRFANQKKVGCTRPSRK